MSLDGSDADAWIGRDLGKHTAAYDERDVILYALAVGAAPADLDLVFEKRLRVLPTFALTKAQWAPDTLGSLGAFDIRTTMHASQRLRVLRPLPPAGELTMASRVARVWDKGSAAIFEVEVESEFFVATWSLFAPGRGGFGGERGPSAPRRRDTPPGHESRLATRPDQPALYRLLGDRHHMHIDPEAAKAAGMPRPFMHGLCTLAAVTLPLAAAVGAHPADLVELEGRFASPVFPGDRLDVRGWELGGPGEGTLFDASVNGTPVLTGGRAQFRVST
ncbi:3-alpha,7-alpha,12-alpha-trihydroxy-5-beta-choles t-24-enoyl-CoA hydratase [Planotetraspora silvatica]|uniref:3-alpha,7-alpha, 12-alpha-trihydroxy-5-beta-choles t-24-enoyl-CoA hydratase n=1 Tax=Planotetraspora silvatica TaxID=234614 RepID=A0A8J3XL29_9ACTN|nr:MaoC/PaaZ C-terminal domain-containing protein [Planotetraspora silvatica]GII45064.1 3-alpha,7-alpha,12-alpha-trihydroxy-5-beta-choles t-24-enoyl-CoA hydratase [Planotetraspora silvatica]